MYRALLWLSRISFFCVFAFIIAFSTFSHAVTFADCNGGIYSNATTRNAAAVSAGQSIPNCAANNGAFVGPTSFNDAGIVGAYVHPRCGFLTTNGSSFTDTSKLFCSQTSLSGCPAGSVPDASTGLCKKICTIPGQVNDSSGNCVCPSGTSSTYGDPVLSMRYSGNPSGPSGCMTQANACASQAGAKAPSNSLQSQILGCTTSCQVSTSGDYKYLCTYTGGAATGTCTTINADGSACGTDPAGNTNTPETNVNPADSGGNCPAGTTAGTVNGKKYCAGSGNTNIAQSGTQTGQNTNGTNTQVSSTTTQTTTNANGTTTTTVITTTSGALGSSANPTFAKLDPNAPNAVSIKGAGSCDPTKSDYAQCIGMSGQGQCVDNPSTPENECTGSGDGEGAGDCDPTAADYIECISSGSTLEHTDNGGETYESVTQDFIDGIEGSPIGQVASGLTGTMSAGTCPVASFEMFNRTYAINQHCTMLDDNGSIISVMAHLCWVVVGIRILMSA